MPRAEVWGHPIGHSRSPQLHRAAYRALGLAEWDYGRRDVTEAALPAEFARLGEDVAGLSLTMPLKRAIIPLLGRLDPLAGELGVVNTVVFEGAARVATGYNTDVYGIAEALRRALPVRDVAPGRPMTQGGPVIAAGAGSAAGPGEGSASGPKLGVVLGSGATAVSAVAALAQLGVASLTIVTRDPAGAGAALGVATRLGVKGRALAWADLRELGPGERACDVAVSTLPGKAAAAIVREFAAVLPLPALAALDVAYPQAPVGEVWAQAVPVAPGTEMLLHQAVRQVELMTGRPAPEPAMRAALAT